jgi:hypothetical protein
MRAPNPRAFLGSVCLLALTACATELAPNADKVRIVTAAQKPQCESLGVIGTEQRTGPNKPSNAMNKALNEVARRGGNGIFVVSTRGIHKRLLIEV